ncbi:MAG TPA: MarR family transcriptional regulator [Candidatus Competibacteraceae bacterium]|nr:MarR family transcriptional regulator [Candidatus Competibacteraceae bacterium]
MELTPIAQRFVLHWGEMGPRWGISRTMAQIYALLFLSERPLPAKEIASTLRMARSSVRTSLRELQSWRLVKVVHVMGDRRNHFEAIQDVWETFRLVVEERKRREIDPTLTVLRQCVREGRDAAGNGPDPNVPRIASVLDFLELLIDWSEELKRLPPEHLIRLMHWGAKILHWLPGGGH